MYRAKDMVGNAYQFLTREMSDETQHRVDLETGVRAAIEHNQLQLAYQPKVDLATGRITGCEALLRWNHPEVRRRLPRAVHTDCGRIRAHRSHRGLGAAHRLRPEQGLAVCRRLADLLSP